jgi:hypothetical protein
MLIDHIGAVLFPELVILRIIGRVAFPIFAFLIVEGFFHTKNIRKYLLRLLIFAFISEVFFDLATAGTYCNLSHQNVFFTLFLGLLAITVYDKLQYAHMAFAIILVMLIHMLAFYLATDYSFFGVFLIFAFYISREHKIQQITSGGIALIMMSISYSSLQYFSLIALGLIWFYNGQKGRSYQYIFYAFYPVHLFILYLISDFMDYL